LNSDLGLIDKHIDELLIFRDVREDSLNGEEALEALHPIRDPLKNLCHPPHSDPLDQIVVAIFDGFPQVRLLGFMAAIT